MILVVSEVLPPGVFYYSRGSQASLVLDLKPLPKENLILDRER